ncbi:hypothetical protein [Streptomyces sp. HYC2]|uniref:hypothetical protein n=1 Tax=Streptomyces sp. HYC2 TaxID=2955207 RepID=UPI00247FEC42|nr:hypothetical protein [Streptomyces sp. HYC2]
MSRYDAVRAPFLEHRPYRFRERTDVELLLPDTPYDPDDPDSLLPLGGTGGARGACHHGAVSGAGG